MVVSRYCSTRSNICYHKRKRVSQLVHKLLYFQLQPAIRYAMTAAVGSVRMTKGKFYVFFEKINRGRKRKDFSIDFMITLPSCSLKKITFKNEFLVSQTDHQITSLALTTLPDIASVESHIKNLSICCPA